MGALRESKFRLLFIGQAVSSLGNSLVPVALAFAVLDLTGSASDLGYVLGAEAVGQLTFLLIGGVVADRISRRAVMIASDSVRGVAQLFLGILLVTAHPALTVLVGFSTIVGSASGMFQPASNGLMPAVVSDEYLLQANALRQTASAAAGLAGPPIAGVFLFTVGPGWALIVDAGTFIVNVAMLAQIRFPDARTSHQQHWVQDLLDGWKDFLARTWFRNVVLGASLLNFLFATYFVLGPLMAKHYYHGATAWAIISTSMAAGSVLAGLITTRLRPRRPLRTAVLFVALIGLSPLAFAGLLPIPVIAIAAALTGAGLVIFGSLWQTSVQRHIPAHMLSRASAYDYFCSLIATPIGLAIVGPVAAVTSPRLILLSASGLSTLVVIGMLLAPSVRNLKDQVPLAEQE